MYYNNTTERTYYTVHNHGNREPDLVGLRSSVSNAGLTYFR